jgi:hypothetical protein
MIKREELTNPKSCMSRAADGEMTFVLLARDVSAPFAIRTWVAERIRRGKNKWDDPQILEAEHCADYMEQQRKDRIGLDPSSSTPASPPAEPAPTNSCNRHNNCEVAIQEWLAKYPNKKRTDIPFSFHCHAEDCEDCFGC